MEDISKWTTLILFGGLLGIIGQGVRTIVGMKKLTEEATKAGKDFRELFSTGSLVMSLFIGFIAGGLAAIVMLDPANMQNDIRQNMLMLLGSGYAGTDFIEGLISKYVPASQGAAPLPSAPPKGDAQGADPHPAVG